MRFNSSIPSAFEEVPSQDLSKYLRASISNGRVGLRSLPARLLPGQGPAPIIWKAVPDLIDDNPIVVEVTLKRSFGIIERCLLLGRAIKEINKEWGKSYNELHCNLHPLESIASSIKEALKKLEESKGKNEPTRSKFPTMVNLDMVDEDSSNEDDSTAIYERARPLKERKMEAKQFSWKLDPLPLGLCSSVLSVLLGSGVSSQNFLFWNLIPFMALSRDPSPSTSSKMAFMKSLDSRKLRYMSS
ncbi:unnamed protein product [Lepeophtheirus salmonis]|uniref:(salmon louse) hypothetical protein n=1 Tax=Lepeophtheirus salmonis TaxID=72036 RepID=A0A7R8D2T7_LEPSM|nr:unnamed protein product [Lepeophtheirus salmonis]CAF3006221.1 unnamed protein product [Lepeophtheirus salmonis]